MASQRLKTKTVKSDGTSSREPFDIEIIDPQTGNRILDEHKRPCVVVVALPMEQEEWRAILKSTETTGQDELTGQIVRRSDYETAVDILCVRSIQSWKGIDGADDKPLVCNDATKARLPVEVKQQVWRKVLGAEVVAEIQIASFREPAGVS